MKLHWNIQITPVRLIAMGFVCMIALGTLLLSLPVSQKPGVTISPMDVLFTAASAVCVTGLVTIDIVDCFTAFGQAVIGVLLQIGGLGVTSIGLGLVALTGKKMSLREQVLIKEALNMPNLKNILSLVRSMLIATIVIELTGAVCSFFVLRKDFPLQRAIGLSMFHAVSAFNNAGFDLFNGDDSLAQYCNNMPLMLVTYVLVIIGGLGFVVIRDLWQCRFRISRCMLHTKVVVMMSAALLVIGTILFRCSGSMNWQEAVFYSVSARTAGFSIMPLSSFSNGALLVLLFLMFVGGSPGSTAGGVKTTTLFILLKAVCAYPAGKDITVFHKRLPRDSVLQAFVLVGIGVSLVFIMVLLISILEPALSLAELLSEVIAAFGTGLSTGVTGELHTPTKLLLILAMYLGRLGPWTIATVWIKRKPVCVRLPEDRITIG